ncbi:MAG TPA: hypothetical protein VMY42_07520 [Thermoguttaceae bacterium]|nr:hypothetical protein [Thermoguttaceae bacterium]
MSRPIAILALLLLPAVTGADEEPATAEQARFGEEVARLIEGLDNDRFEVRRRAAARLEELVADPQWQRLLAEEFHRVLARVDVSSEVRWRLRQWCGRLPEVVRRPAENVSEEGIDRLVEKLDDEAFDVREGAARRLEELSLQDEPLPWLKKALQARLAGPITTEAAVRVNRLLQGMRPAMVAEYWYGRSHRTEQHLLIGVPSQVLGAERPSHFDRIDDDLAHCVSGNTLSPGDYPVGVAFPDPVQETGMFHLVNLPTPRRRLEYQRYVQTDESARLTELSRRTLDRVLTERRELSERELIMLGQLDPVEVSRFAGRYFHVVEDGRLPPPQVPVGMAAYPRVGGCPSRFGMICVQLATDGTKDAVPGLLEAIEKARFLPPERSAPYRLQWLAALSIAGRDPWPEVDRWLGSLISHDETLRIDLHGGPELGATAAGLLWSRHGREPPSRDLLYPVVEPLIKSRFRIDGYRFPSDAAREAIRQWWQGVVNTPESSP